MRSDTSEIKTDVRELRAESSATKERLGSVRVEIVNLRDELHIGLAAVRAELHEGLAALRAEMQEGLAALRAEMQEGFAALRAEMLERLAALRAEMRSGDERLHRLIIRTSLTDRIWMLLLTGTMLAVMAHGFKWI
jgi:DNA anti-recombination protein RmuC